MSFKPQNKRSPCMTRQIRVDPEDWRKVESLAISVNETPAEIVRQVIHYVLAKTDTWTAPNARDD